MNTKESHPAAILKAARCQDRAHLGHIAHLPGLLSERPTHCSWSRHSQLAGGAHSLRRPQKWYHRWYCHESRAGAPGLHGGQRVGKWHHQNPWQRHIHSGRTRKEEDTKNMEAGHLAWWVWRGRATPEQTHTETREAENLGWEVRYSMLKVEPCFFPRQWLLSLFLFMWDRLSLCNPSWPQIKTLLLWPPKCWDYRYEPSHLA